MMGKHTTTLAEELAKYATSRGYDSASSAAEGFAEVLTDRFIEGNDFTMDATEEETMYAAFVNFIKDMLVPKADQLISEWRQDAREEYEEREEARRGQY